jgi:hypothetical protein
VTGMTRGRILVAGVALALLTSSPAAVAQAAMAGWSATGSMSVARDHFAAALLETGQLLVVGGADGGRLLATAELYDPGMGTWSLTASMHTPRYARGRRRGGGHWRLS